MSKKERIVSTDDKSIAMLNELDEDIKKLRDNYENLIDTTISIDNFWNFLKNIMNKWIYEYKTPKEPKWDELSKTAKEYLIALGIVFDNYSSSYDLRLQDEVSEYEREFMGKSAQLISVFEDTVDELRTKKQNNTRRSITSTVNPSDQDQQKITYDAILPTYIENDLWTTKDKLNYQIYAIAIANFLTKKETKSPLSISIQSPWGGGKSSLMRMIQKQMDEKGAQLALQKLYHNRSDQEIKLRNLKGEIWKRILMNIFLPWRNKVEIPPFDSAGYEIKPCVTIWFNTWKYESTEQVWSGLADSIVREISSRMNPIERELFFLELNLRRTDFNSIRRWVYDKSITYLWNKIKGWLLPLLTLLFTFLFTYILGMIRPEFMDQIIKLKDLSLTELLRTTGWYGVITTSSFSLLGLIKEIISTENEPSSVVLGDKVRVPNYNDKLGFIHHATEDLEIIFQTIPDRYLPLIIFVDDLDRCSPHNIAQVIEGINLFLAGEFKNCIFVLGMDAEMVAAALEVSHNEVVSKLPLYSTHSPIGWRFMDKFIQLPIIIPPIYDTKEYLGTLFPTESNFKKDVNIDADITSVEVKDIKGKLLNFLSRLTNSVEKIRIGPIEIELNQDRKLEGLNETDKEKIRRITNRIKTLTDQDKEFIDQVSKASSEFSNNPRELKKFANVLRFYRFIWYSIRESSGNEPCSFDQLRRWITLSLRWPSLIRWIYWGQGDYRPESSEMKHKNPTQERLSLLEKIGGESKDFEEWVKLIESSLDVKREVIPWLKDRNLRQFFKNEFKLESSERLSASTGKGIY